MDTGGLLQARVGGIPVVALVAGGAGAIGLFLAVRGRGSGAATSASGVQMLQPSVAEAFGQIQSDQEGLANAISLLGQQGQDILTGTTALQEGQQRSDTNQQTMLDQLQTAIANILSGNAAAANANQNAINWMADSGRTIQELLADVHANAAGISVLGDGQTQLLSHTGLLAAAPEQFRITDPGFVAGRGLNPAQIVGAR